MKKTFNDVPGAKDGLDAALEAFELEPEPAGFTAKVMAQVREAAQPARLPEKIEMPRFRLTLVDYVLSLCAAIMLGSVWLTATSLPPQVELRLRLEGLYWLHRLQFDPRLPWLAAGTGLMVICLALLVWVLLIMKGQEKGIPQD